MNIKHNAKNRLGKTSIIGVVLVSMTLPAVAVTTHVADAQAEPTALEVTESTTIHESTNQPITNTDQAQQPNTQNQAVRLQLQQIITSEDYATSKQHKTWQRKSKETTPEDLEDSWLVKILKFLFDRESDSDSWFDFIDLQVLAAIIKTLLIIALLFFIAWIIRHAQKNGWLNTVLPKKLQKAVVSKTTPTSQQQLGDLPAHGQIAVAAQQFIDAGQLSQAASLLYRGSLRWLADNQLIVVVPATTELQCIKQLQYINSQLNQNINSNITSTAQSYINQIIEHWIQIAYDPSSMSTPMYDEQLNAKLSSQLSKLADEWLTKLPASFPKNTGFNNHDGLKGEA